MNIRKLRERANKVNYADYCFDCVRPRRVCLNRNRPNNKRRCGFCKQLEPVADFHCARYWSRPCERMYSRERAARNGYYAIECSYCGEPITKGPFCGEDCRHKFEKAILESV